MSISIGAGAIALGALASVASASILAPGTYQLRNHPDGSQNPPPYGLRLDELYNATTGHDVFTFDFNHPSSMVQLTFTGTTITISGNAMGGRDIGGSYAADGYTGNYTFSFTYNVGVGLVPGDDDLQVVAASGSNVGSIMTPLGQTIELRDKSDGSNTFQLGNEANDLGHRGFSGISGWGWMDHGPTGSPHVPASDWLFTVIPTPGSAVALLMGGAIIGRRRRA